MTGLFFYFFSSSELSKISAMGPLLHFIQIKLLARCTKAPFPEMGNLKRKGTKSIL